jgi:hypothetical protein
MRDGYYVITGSDEFWCPTRACAKETQRVFGGEIITAAERDRRWAQQARKLRTALPCISQR